MQHTILYSVIVFAFYVVSCVQSDYDTENISYLLLSTYASGSVESTFCSFSYLVLN